MKTGAVPTSTPGHSIIFGCSRGGKPACDTYYADRNAVNIGSSSDRAYHMLWHFQNGGLDDMSKRSTEPLYPSTGFPAYAARSCLIPSTPSPA